MGNIGEEQPEIEIMPTRPAEPERAPAEPQQPQTEPETQPQREPEREPART